MKSYPSSLNESMSMYGSGKYSNYKRSYDITKLKALNLNLSAPVISELLKDQNINIANYSYFQPIQTIDNNNGKENNKVFRENPLTLPYDIISLAKDYEWTYKTTAKSLLGVDKENTKTYTQLFVAPSMFNPLNGINVRGITSNVPLLNNAKPTEKGEAYLSNKKNLTTCTIRELCALSKNPNSVLGMATYKYSDFMYCKDLGKVSNNHLITLRRFAHPVGDHIFELTAPYYVSESLGFDQEGDVGRLVTWFGTDDNQLENIIKFSYRSTWKDLKSEIQEKQSTADDNSTSILGLLSNTKSGVYANAINEGTAGNHSLFAYIGDKLIQKASGGKMSATNGIGKNNELLRNYDENRVYNPKNTIQETSMYEGKIEFTHEFTLNFSYQLRAYDNINPKSAFLDLIGNILEVTGRRGRFWGGQRKLIGPPTDTSMFDKTHALIDRAFDKLGGMWANMDSMGFNLNSLLGAFSNMVKGINMKDQLSQLGESLKSAYKATAPDKSVVTESIKGFVKNALGRPTMIAWNSLLDGSDVGLWHVTIGNPKNPIIAMGNLIVTNSEITQTGPLGLDDFPSELKVTVSLKHARPRDITDISKMYTKGIAAIYHPLAPAGLENFFGSFKSYNTGDNNVSSDSIQEHSEKLTEKQKQTSSEQTTKSISEQSDPWMEKMYRSQASEMAANKSDINTSDIPNPFIHDNLSAMMAQMNNYSTLMATLAADEIV